MIAVDQDSWFEVILPQTIVSEILNLYEHVYKRSPGMPEGTDGGTIGFAKLTQVTS